MPRRLCFAWGRLGHHRGYRFPHRCLLHCQLIAEFAACSSSVGSHLEWVDTAAAAAEQPEIALYGERGGLGGIAECMSL